MGVKPAILTIFSDAGTLKLGTFSVHDYDAEAIKALDKAASTAHIDIEHVSAIATLSAPRNTAIKKHIEDPVGFKDLENIAKQWFKDGAKTCHIDYKALCPKGAQPNLWSNIRSFAADSSI